MTKAYMIMASGTDVGKTYTGCAILRAARARGLSVAAVKPVMSGYSPDQLEHSDAGQLIQAMDKPLNESVLAATNLYRFEPGLAPNIAARQSGTVIDFSQLCAFSRKALSTDADLILVEGAGGVLSPLNDTHYNVDLATALRLSAVLVTANYLGSVSHTLCAIEACNQRRIPVACVIVSQPEECALEPQPLVEELRHWCRLPILALNFNARGDQILDHLLNHHSPSL